MVLKTLSSSFRVSDHHRSRRCYATASSLRAFVSTRGPQLDGADEPFGPERRVLGLDAGLDGRDRGVEEVEVGLDGLQVLLAVRSRCYCEGKDLCNSRVQCLGRNVAVRLLDLLQRVFASRVPFAEGGQRARNIRLSLALSGVFLLDALRLHLLLQLLVVGIFRQHFLCRLGFRFPFLLLLLRLERGRFSLRALQHPLHLVSLRARVQGSLETLLGDLPALARRRGVVVHGASHLNVSETVVEILPLEHATRWLLEFDRLGEERNGVVVDSRQTPMLSDVEPAIRSLRVQLGSAGPHSYRTLIVCHVPFADLSSLEHRKPSLLVVTVPEIGPPSEVLQGFVEVVVARPMSVADVLCRIRPSLLQMRVSDVIHGARVIWSLLEVLVQPHHVPRRLVPRAILVPAGVLLNLKVDQRLKDFLAGDGRSCDTLMRAPFHLCSWQVAVDPVHITHSASLVRPDAVHVLGAVHSELVLVEARRDGGKVCI
mmetsp:Transcript_45406/g.106648  ORF Transcript_45406/g.106648 Transcript_45406/m.106648 type:complete len:484 (+) Transcript_45406:31-1482(+)